jgi:hypothetical protein
MLAYKFYPLAIFVLFCRIITIFKYSGYSETVKFGVVRSESACAVVQTTCMHT